MLPLICLMTCSCHQTSVVNDYCLLAQPIYVNNSDEMIALARSKSLADKIKKHNAIWEVTCK